MNKNDIIRWFYEYFQNFQAFGPIQPPKRMNIILDNTKKLSAQTMFILAILGWILPIIPGTPFFLMAWALGWRPEGSKH